MMSLAELIERVDAAFETTAAGFVRWDDPNPNRSPSDDAYSRVTNPEKWRIAGARADAWLLALADAGVATIERDVSVNWMEQAPTVITRADRATPCADGAIPLVIARSRIESVDDAGITIGVGDPTTAATWIPDCGCDACDSGSQDALDLFDEYAVAIVTGQFRRLTKREQSITLMPDTRQARNVRSRRIDAILAKPKGWTDMNGASWLTAP